ncbi:MAG: hypothetical protein RL754_896 [Bacteroidota bacterium]|jgi:agmatinase
MDKASKIEGFDPNGLATSDGLFGLPFTLEECEIEVLPVPWEVSVSYGSGTAAGPAAILEASKQVDLYDPEYPEGWKRGIGMHPVNQDWAQRSEELRVKAEAYIEALEGGDEAELASALHEINLASEDLNQWVEDQCADILNRGKRLVLLGGDHSTPLGAYRALKKHHGEFGVLHLDAHADLRPAYEGFTYSHASIMYNALNEELFESITMVGLRDFCHQEAALMDDDGRIMAFTDRSINKVMYEGHPWSAIVDQILMTLPQKVHLSFDIDALDPSLCPNTGTPVPGGMNVNQVLYLIDRMIEAGHEFIGMDLVEVSPGEDEWDANVGARMLYNIALRLS